METALERTTKKKVLLKYFIRQISPFTVFLSIAGLIATIGSLKLIRTFGRKSAEDFMGEGGFPFLTSILVILFAMITFIYDWKSRRPSNSIEMRIDSWVYDIRIVRWMATTFLTALFIMFVSYVSFFVTSGIYLFFMAVLGKRDKLHLVLYFLISLGTTFIVYWSYTKLLQIPVPGAI